MTPFLSVRYLLQYVRRRLVNNLNAGKIRQVPDLLGQGAVCPLYNLRKACGICGLGHEANFTTKASAKTAGSVSVISLTSSPEWWAIPRTSQRSFRYYFTGTNTGAPLFFTRNTTNFAGLVWLAFRPTIWTSSGPS